MSNGNPGRNHPWHGRNAATCIGNLVRKQGLTAEKNHTTGQVEPPAQTDFDNEPKKKFFHEKVRLTRTKPVRCFPPDESSE